MFPLKNYLKEGIPSDQEKMLEINLKQKEFYDSPQTNKGFFTKVWSQIRNSALHSLRSRLNITKDIYDLHKIWAGDVKDKRVLDLGCYAGNELSIYFATNAQYYLGIDLSHTGIEKLNAKLKKIGNDNASAIQMDFLSNEFVEYGPFDIIYVYSAMHHFQYLETFLKRLDTFLKPGGIIISYDPLQTYWIMRLLRAVYRPFQSDADWEYPFNRKTFSLIKYSFEIEKIQGVLNKSKWGFLLNFVPINSNKKKQILIEWHQQDMVKATNLKDNYLYNCLHVSMLLRKEA